MTSEVKADRRDSEGVVKVRAGFEFVASIPEGYTEFCFYGNTNRVLATAKDKPPVIFNEKTKIWDPILGLEEINTKKPK